MRNGESFVVIKFLHIMTLCLILLSLGCARKELERRSWLSMGTFANVTVPGTDAENLTTYADIAQTNLQKMEEAWSIFIPESEISELNATAGHEAVKISSGTRYLLEQSVFYGKVSRGSFDITIDPLIRLWGFGKTGPPDELLAPKVVASALKSVGYGHIVMSNDTSQAFLDQPGVSVNLGGMAKGYAVDVCYDKITAMGGRNIMVNLGGNIRCAGQPYPGESWRIGVRDPFDNKKILGRLTLTNGQAVATSGNYERFVVIGDKRYAHIIDPRTGYPVEGMVGVTVMAPNGLQADVMSTALFVLGLKDAPPVLRQAKGCEALFVPDKKPIEIWVTPGFAKAFEPMKEYADAVKELTIPDK